MKRALIVLLAPFLGSAAHAPSPPSRSMPDVVEAGRVAATLSDWQTITYFLIFLLVVGTAERFFSYWQARNTSRDMAAALDRLGEAVRLQGTDIKVALAVIQQQHQQVLQHAPGGQPKDG